MRIIKILLMIFSLIKITGISALAGVGEILVFEAPIFLKPDLKAAVIQKYKQGDLIYIHQSHFRSPSMKHLSKSIYPLLSREESLKDHHLSKNKLFYLTIDKNGRNAYIPRKFVRLIYNDKRDLAYIKISKKKFESYEAPKVPETYPLAREDSFKGMFTLGINTQEYDSYSFTTEELSRTNGVPFEVTFAYGKNFTLGSENVFTFGGMLVINVVHNTFTLDQTRIANEEKLKLGLGPFLSYDLLKSSKYYFTFYGGPLLCLDYLSIEHQDYYSLDNRRFYAFYLSLKTGFVLGLKNFLPDLDFLIGLSTRLALPRTLGPIDSFSVSKFWQQNEDEDVIKKNFEIEMGIFLGIQKVI